MGRLRRLALTFGVPVGVVGAVGSYRKWLRQHILDEPVGAVKDIYASPEPRDASIRRLRNSVSEPFDVLVVGGGSVGCGCALEAARRGLSVALVEAEDFSAGASSKSTKLVHGGLRYLEQAVKHFDLSKLTFVAEGLRERDAVVASAPHLAHPLPTLLPAYSIFELVYSFIGLKLYDVLSGVIRPTLFESSRLVSSAEHAASQFNTICRDGLKGGVLYFDGTFADDSRYCVSQALTAQLHSAAIANHCEATGLYKGAESVWVECNDKLYQNSPFGGSKGDKFTVQARNVICAGGALADKLKQLEDGASEHTSDVYMTPSTGAHIALPRYFSQGSGAGLIVPRTQDGRVAFVLPFGNETIAGTTDVALKPFESPTLHPYPTADQIHSILESIQPYLSMRVTYDDVRSAWSGLRPLSQRKADSQSTSTAAASRDHTVEVSSSKPQIIHVHGGKWTTWRVVANDAVRTLNLPAAQKSRSSAVPLLGSANWRPDLSAELAQQFSRILAPDTAQHLVKAYGDRSLRVATIASEEPRANFRLHDRHPHIEAEVRYAARCEMCETAQDFMARRSCLVFVDANAAYDALSRVITLLAQEHGWGLLRRRQEYAAAKRFICSFYPPRQPSTSSATTGSHIPSAANA